MMKYMGKGNEKQEGIRGLDLLIKIQSLLDIDISQSEKTAAQK
jgi:hypothetical protein